MPHQHSVLAHPLMMHSLPKPRHQRGGGAAVHCEPKRPQRLLQAVTVRDALSRAETSCLVIWTPVQHLELDVPYDNGFCHHIYAKATELLL